MKLTAKIEWVIDDPVMGVESGMEEDVFVDSDCVESTETDLVEWLENMLTEKYDTPVAFSSDEADGRDFVVLNMGEVLNGIRYEEYLDAACGEPR